MKVTRGVQDAEAGGCQPCGSAPEGNVSCSLSYVVASEKVPPTPTGDGSSSYSLMGIYLGALCKPFQQTVSASRRCGVHHRTLPASNAEFVETRKTSSV